MNKQTLENFLEKLNSWFDLLLDFILDFKEKFQDETVEGFRTNDQFEIKHFWATPLGNLRLTVKKVLKSYN